MSARKIRMTAVGLVAMPAAYDERLVTADDLAQDTNLCPAFAELQWHEQQAAEGPWTLEQWETAEAVDVAWYDALDAANRNDLEGLHAALLRARALTAGAGYDTGNEDAALAMLADNARRAA